MNKSRAVPGQNPPHASATRKLAGIVLAAGLSSRMKGAFKPLLEFAGTSIVARVVKMLQSDPRIDPLLVVVGFRCDDVKDALLGADVNFVYNPSHEHGEMLSSIQAGIAALRGEIGGFALALGDQPGISPESVRLLVEAWEHTPDAIVIPTYRGNRGHPVLIPSRCVPEILDLRSNQTLKAVTHRPGQQVVEISVEDPAIRMDIDTPQDYQEALRHWSQRPPAQNGTEALHGPSPG